jgi:hypothetical protein
MVQDEEKSLKFHGVLDVRLYFQIDFFPKFFTAVFTPIFSIFMLRYGAGLIRSDSVNQDPDPNKE